MPAYNDIEEEADRYILLKNPDLPVVGTLPFKGIIVEWGQAGNVFNPLLKIRRILYPKADYDRAAVEAIAQSTENCPFCREGKALETVPVEDLFKYAPATSSQPASEADSTLKWLQHEWDDFWRLTF